MNEFLEMNQEQWANYFRENSLERLAKQLQEYPYPNYPAFNDRLWSEDEELLFNPIHLPIGPWETSAGEVPNIADQQALANKNLRLDAYGRPLHPWFDEMLTNPNIGVVTGKGFYWQWGPNYTADSIIVRHDLEEPHLLLITRRDTGQWALPGGFINPNETAMEAAMREVGEETGIDLYSLYPIVRKAYRGVLADVRVTANAWPETTAYAFTLSAKRTQHLPLGPYEADDDAEIAQWFPISQLSDQLFGSHYLLVQLGLLQPGILTRE